MAEKPHQAKGFWDQRIVGAVGKRLRAKGLTDADSNPEVWVAYSKSTHEQFRGSFLTGTKEWETLRKF